MFKKSIKSRVWDTINQKILAAQTSHEEHCKMLDEKVEKEKLENEDLVVSNLLGKFY